MKPDDQTYEVVMNRAVRWRDAQDQMIWLVSQEITEGRFNNGRRRIMRGEGSEEVTWYRFTDKNTAFLFKLHFG